MSIARMKKVTIAAPATKKGELVAALHEWGNMHIDDIQADNISRDNPDDINELERFVSEINTAVEFLDSVYIPEKKPNGTLEFLQSFFLYREAVPPEMREHPDRYIPEAEETVKAILDLKKRYDSLNRDLSETRKLIESLEDMKDMNLPLEVINGTRRTRFYLVWSENKSFPLVKKKLSESDLRIHYSIVHRDKKRTVLSIVCFREDADAVEILIQDCGLKEIVIPEGLKGTPRQEIEKLYGMVLDMERKIDKIVHRANTFYEKKKTLLVVADYLSNMVDRGNVPALFGRSRRAVIVTGWVEASKAEELRGIVRSIGGCSVVIDEPGEGDEPPIKLQNPRWLQPLELVTELYSMPRYNEFDPTPLIAPFFLIYFAFCLSDAGYGILLMVSAALMKKFLVMGRDGERLFTLLIIEGLLTIVVGAFFGSWFGLPREMLPSALVNIAVVDPMNEPIKLLVFYVFLGLVQAIYAGNIIGMAKKIKNGDKASAVMDEGSILLFMTLLILYGVAMIGYMPSSAVLPLKYSVIGALILLFLSNARNGDGIVGKLGAGVWGLYNTLVGTLSDLLSYSRLLALGLATSAIGMVFDYMGFMVMGGQGLMLIIGVAIGFLIIVAGSLFNLFLSSMGAFVHSLRLQYVEYFSRFYEGGGRPFSPFKKDYKYTRIDVKTTEV